MNIAEVIVFNGIPFRRYPQSTRNGAKNYYIASGGYRALGVTTLHREIWKTAHGPIPKGSEIHHIDLNPLNNHISNLQCLTKAEHCAIHTKNATVSQLKAWENFRKYAARHATNWHKSDEGRRWHSAQAKINIEKRMEPRSYICSYCQQPYVSRSIMRSGLLYCSKACKAAARRSNGTDNETRSCEQCGGEFMVNKYTDITHCSKHCAAVTREQKKRQKISDARAQRSATRK